MAVEVTVESEKDLNRAQTRATVPAVSLSDFRGFVWAHRELRRLAANDRQVKGAQPVRTWRIKFWAWLSRISHRRLMTLAIREQHHTGIRLARFQQRWNHDHHDRMVG